VHATLFTGLYPHEHGNRVNGHLLRRDVPVLAELLSRAGFATGAFVSGAPMKAEASQLDRGFGIYEDGFAGRRRDGRKTTARALVFPFVDRYVALVRRLDGLVGRVVDVMRRIFSVRSEGWKLIAYPAREGEIFELYDLRADPGETCDVASENRAKTRELLRALDAWNGDRSRPIATVGISDELHEQLRSLGYLD
jgi:arylsulfatase A-like enzyme